jgi:hypothetical protein
VEAFYHRQVLERAIGSRISPRALALITEANLSQDSLAGLLRFEYHFDNSLFERGLAYIETQRALAAAAPEPGTAWRAFGRLSHGAQDFYSHSNYVALWLGRFPAGGWPPPESITALDPAILNHPRLRSGRIYLPLEALCLVPALQPGVKRLLPRDSHAWVNLDGPESGPLFPYSLETALQRTTVEFERTLAAISAAHGADAAQHFLG